MGVLYFTFFQPTNHLKEKRELYVFCCLVRLQTDDNLLKEPSFNTSLNCFQVLIDHKLHFLQSNANWCWGFLRGLHASSLSLDDSSRLVSHLSKALLFIQWPKKCWFILIWSKFDKNVVVIRQNVSDGATVFKERGTSKFNFSKVAKVHPFIVEQNPELKCNFQQFQTRWGLRRTEDWGKCLSEQPASSFTLQEPARTTMTFGGEVDFWQHLLFSDTQMSRHWGNFFDVAHSSMSAAVKVLHGGGVMKEKGGSSESRNSYWKQTDRGDKGSDEESACW